MPIACPLTVFSGKKWIPKSDNDSQMNSCRSRANVKDNGLVSEWLLSQHVLLCPQSLQRSWDWAWNDRLSLPLIWLCQSSQKPLHKPMLVERNSVKSAMKIAFIFIPAGKITESVQFCSKLKARQDASRTVFSALDFCGSQRCHRVAVSKQNLSFVRYLWCR